MKQEALRELDRQEFRRVVRNVLKAEPEGLRAVALWERVVNHPELDIEAPMKYFHVWLHEISKEDAVVIDSENKRYLHPKHSG